MHSRHDWWKTFFEGSVVDFWRAVVPPEATRAEADFLQRQIAPPAGGRLLDVPCGDGRLSLELARRGYAMTGVDLSRDFLAAARRSSRRQGLSIQWRRSDMRDLPWKDRFDGAFCGGSSFGYLGDEADAEYLGAVCRCLKPGARFVIDAVKAAEVVLANFRKRWKIEAGGVCFIAENRYDKKTGWIDNRYTISRGGRVERRVAAHRVYTRAQVVAMLKAQGFGRCTSLGSLDGEPFRKGSSRLILVATRTVA